MNRNKYTPGHMVKHQKQRGRSNQRLLEIDYLQRAPARLTAYLDAATELGRQRNNIVIVLRKKQ